MKTLWAATGIFILPVNESILIVSLRACRMLPPDWVNELQLEMLGASDEHLVSLWITKYLHCEFNLCIYMAKGVSISAAKPFKFWLILIFLVHCGIHCKTGSHLEDASLKIKRLQFAQFKHFSLFSAFEKIMQCLYSTCIKSFYPFGFKCNSWKADNKLESC